MDDDSGKRVIAGVGFGRRGSSLAFRGNQEERNIQYCNRLGCSTRLNSMRGTQINNPEKLNLPRSSFRPTSSKATVGSSSRAFPSLNDHRKSQRGQRNAISLQETVSVDNSSRDEEAENYESSSTQEDIVILGSDPAAMVIQTVIPEPDDLESAVLQGFSINTTEASRSFPISSNSRPRKAVNRITGSGNQDTPSSSSVRRSVTSRNAVQVVKPTSQGEGASAHRYGLKSLSCTSISDVLPSGCSSSDASLNRRESTRRRYTEGESSSARGKGTIGSSNGGNSGCPRSGPSGPSISLLDRSLPQPVSRRTRNRPTTRDEVVSVRTRRSNVGQSRLRLYENGNDNTFSLPEPLMVPPLPQPQFSIAEAATANSSRSFSTERAPVCQTSYGRPGSSRGTYRNRPASHLEDRDSRVFHGPLVDRDGYRRINMEGIAEVLLALERIEQDEELTYEQLMVLETNLFLGGISFHDQHREMRLDIDNMSYEELLALEEKMGTVSTALSEEALSACLRKTIYMPTSLSVVAGCGDDDIKCSICQEEYVAGDEVGKLGCDHRYHVPCIHQWLQQKNWCPICKASASLS